MHHASPIQMHLFTRTLDRCPLNEWLASSICRSILVVSPPAGRKIGSGATFIGFTILWLCHYSTRRALHPRYCLYIVAENIQPSNFGSTISRNISENPNWTVCKFNLFVLFGVYLAWITTDYCSCCLPLAPRNTTSALAMDIRKNILDPSIMPTGWSSRPWRNLRPLIGLTHSKENTSF
jgi:hypothetical protein